MIITRNIRIKNFKAKLPDDYGGMISVSIDSRLFNFSMYKGIPVYVIEGNNIKVFGRYPSNWWKRMLFKLKENLFPSKIRIEYFASSHQK